MLRKEGVIKIEVDLCDIYLGILGFFCFKVVKNSLVTGKKRKCADVLYAKWTFSLIENTVLYIGTVVQ